jgi:hypothetical protein
MLGEAARRRRVVDHRRDHRRRAGVGEPARQREVANRYARDRRLAGERDGEDRLRSADEVDAAVLQVERHRVERFARQGASATAASLTPTQAESTSRRSASPRASLPITPPSLIAVSPWRHAPRACRTGARARQSTWTAARVNSL